MAFGANKVREDVQPFLDFLASAGGPQLYELALTEARAVPGTIGPLVDLPARELAVIRDLVCPGPAGDIPLRLFDAQAKRGPGPVILYFHGGGFVVGDIDCYHSFCSEIAAETGLPVVSVDYRLAPENPFPAAPDDCEAVARWAADSPAALGLEVTGLVPMGDSAGGNLAIVVTAALTEKPAGVPVVAQVPIYPIAGLISHHQSFIEFGKDLFLTSELMGWFTRSYGADETSPRAYPLVEEDHSRTPPTVVLTAGLDPLRDSGREYAAHLASQGVDVTLIEAKGVIHGFVTMRKAITSTAADLQRLYGVLKVILARQA